MRCVQTWVCRLSETTLKCACGVGEGGAGEGGRNYWQRLGPTVLGRRKKTGRWEGTWDSGLRTPSPVFFPVNFRIPTAVLQASLLRSHPPPFLRSSLPFPSLFSVGLGEWALGDPRQLI